MGRSVETKGNDVIYFDASEMGYEEIWKCTECGYDEHEEMTGCPDCGCTEIEHSDEYNECSAEMDWENLDENIRCDIMARYKSMYKVDNVYRMMGHYYREQVPICANGLIGITISEYCGCGAVSVFVRDDCEYPELAGHWLDQNYENIKKIVLTYVSGLVKMGTFSNGCGVFRKVD